ncbi:MAG: hypothetical protein ACNA8W_25835 [Bradymonadaceae bacterium]
MKLPEIPDIEWPTGGQDEVNAWVSAWSALNEAVVAEVMKILELSDTVTELAEGLWELCGRVPVLHGSAEKMVRVNEAADFVVVREPETYNVAAVKRGKDGVWKVVQGHGERPVEGENRYEPLARRIVKAIFDWDLNHMHMARIGQDRMDGSID